MKAMETLAQYLQTEGGQKAYVEWGHSAITQQLLAAALEQHGRVRPPPLGQGPVDAAAALFENGRSCGANDVVEFLRSADAVSGALTGGGLPALVATYGAGEILKEME
jgi:hypothetical protein